MDGNAMKSTEVTVDEIIGALNNQIASLNFELTASKITIKKLQEALEDSESNSKKDTF